MKVKSVAIVGLGSIGRRHLNLIKTLRPEIEVTLVRSGYGGQWQEEALANHCVTNIAEAVEIGIDAAIISSPANCHFRHAKETMQFRIPTLIEKPLTMNLQEAIFLKNLTEEQSTLLMVGYVLRHNEAAQCFNEQMLIGRIGKPLFAKIECGSYLPDWRPNQDYRASASARRELGGGALMELSHELDYANWFFGGFINVTAALHNSESLKLEVEDTACLIMQTKTKMPVTIHLDFCRREPARNCCVFGQEGMLCWDAIEHQVTLLPAKNEANTWQFDRDQNAMYEAQLQNFLECIEQGKTPKVMLEDGIEVMRLIDAARQSSYEARQVNL